MARRWCLPMDHKDRLVPVITSYYWAYKGEVQPNDLYRAWLVRDPCVYIWRWFAKACRQMARLVLPSTIHQVRTKDTMSTIVTSRSWWVFCRVPRFNHYAAKQDAIVYWVEAIIPQISSASLVTAYQHGVWLCRFDQSRKSKRFDSRAAQHRLADQRTHWSYCK